MLVASTGSHLFKCLVSNRETTIISLYRKEVNEQNLGFKYEIVSVFTTCHSGHGFSYFSCYGNSILYNEIVEIGGYTIQLYYKLEQPFRSYCHKKYWDFCIQANGWCTTFVHQNGLSIHFQRWVANIQILITSHYQLQII